jgi:hypothetical protein
VKLLYSVAQVLVSGTRVGVFVMLCVAGLSEGAQAQSCAQQRDSCVAQNRFFVWDKAEVCRCLSGAEAPASAAKPAAPAKAETAVLKPVAPAKVEPATKTAAPSPATPSKAAAAPKAEPAKVDVKAAVITSGPPATKVAEKAPAKSAVKAAPAVVRVAGAEPAGQCVPLRRCSREGSATKHVKDQGCACIRPLK